MSCHAMSGRHPGHAVPAGRGRAAAVVRMLLVLLGMFAVLFGMLQSRVYGQQAVHFCCSHLDGHREGECGCHSIPRARGWPCRQAHQCLRHKRKTHQQQC